MSQNDVFQVSIREDLGKHRTRRLREHGHTPVVLYGHGKETVSLSVPTSEVLAVLRRGGKVVQLEGSVQDSALVREVQWDAMGNDVLHLDLTRVSAREMVETSVPIELKGEAPGARAGGLLKHTLHEIEIRCSVASIPQRMTVSISNLEIGDSITVADLELPSGATALSEDSMVIVQCVEPIAEEEVEEAAAAEGVEPEVIGRKEDGEEGDKES